MSRTQCPDGSPTLRLIPSHAHSLLRLGHDSLRHFSSHQYMPKARRFVPMYAKASTDEDILPRLSQQRRLFSNLDRSMKHEKGSVFGATTLIAGTFPAASTGHVMGISTSLHIAWPFTDTFLSPIKARLHKHREVSHLKCCRHHSGSWHPCSTIHHTGLRLHPVLCFPLWHLCIQHSYRAALGGSKCQPDVRAWEGEPPGLELCRSHLLVNHLCPLNFLTPSHHTMLAGWGLYHLNIQNNAGQHGREGYHCHLHDTSLCAPGSM